MNCCRHLPGLLTSMSSSAGSSAACALKHSTVGAATSHCVMRQQVRQPPHVRQPDDHDTLRLYHAEPTSRCPAYLPEKLLQLELCQQPIVSLIKRTQLEALSEVNR
jgi:hypothetical protein